MSDRQERPVLELRDVSHGFGDLTVLEDVTLAVSRGTVACLLGPNGSGKSTLVSIAAGLRDPDEGTVDRPVVDGRAIGYLPQRPAFRPSFTVAETIDFYGDLVAEPVSTDALLERVGLDGVADRRVDQLSGGMVRLLGLAQATVGSPPILLLDEPASGLDPQLRRHIADVIADLADDGRAVLMATHDLTATDRIGDTVSVLDDGSFLATGSSDEIRTRTDTESLESAIDELIDRQDAVAVRTGREER